MNVQPHVDSRAPGEQSGRAEANASRPADAAARTPIPAAPVAAQESPEDELANDWLTTAAPAWLASAVIHMVLFVAGALFLGAVAHEKSDPNVVRLESV